MSGSNKRTRGWERPRSADGSYTGPKGRPWCRSCAAYKGQYVEIGPRRQMYCSTACADEYAIRNFPAEARRLVGKRDHGVCARCNLDTAAFREIVRGWEAAWERSKLDWQCRWQAEDGSNPEYARHCEIGDRDKITFYLALVNHSTSARRLYGDRYVAPLRAMGFDLARQAWWDADHIVPVVEGGGECGLENYRTLCVPCHKTVTAELRRRLALTRNPNGPTAKQERKRSLLRPLPLEYQHER